MCVATGRKKRQGGSANLAEVERLKAEAEASAQRFRDLVQGLNAIVWEADPATLQFSFVSERAADILGYPASQWLSEPDFWSNHIHPDDREAVVAARHAAVATGGNHELEYRLLAADGRPVWVHGSCRVVGDARGQARVLRGVLVDITERKRADAVRARLTTVVEATTDFVGISDPQGRELYINRAGRKMLGLPDDADVSQMLVTEQQPPWVNHLIREEAIPAALRDGVWSGETALLTPEGHELPLSQVVLAHKTPDGRVDFFATIGRDIGDRKRAEERMAGLLEIVKETSGTLDLDQLLQKVLRRTAALLPCDRVITYYWNSERQIFHDVARYGLPDELVADAVAMEFRPGTPLVDRLAQGQTVVINDTAEQQLIPRQVLDHFGIRALLAVPLVVRGRRLGALVGVRTQPVRRFERDEAQLLESIARQLAMAIETVDLYRAQQEEAQIAAALARVGQALISSLDTPVVLDRLCQLTIEMLGCDRSHTILWDPQELAYIPVAGSGYPAEEWQALRLLKIPAANLTESLALLDEQGVRQQVLSELGDPAMRALSHQLGMAVGLGMALRRGNETIGFLSACRQREERFTPQQERIAAGIAQLGSMALENARLVEQLARADRLRSEFVATMSHELRTPLNVIVGYNELLLDQVFGTLTAEQTDALGRVEKSARELLDLINATLDMSRLESGRIALSLEDVWVPDLLREIDGEIRTLREKPGVRFAWKVPQRLPQLRTDPTKLKIVLKNLISNAVKFTQAGSVTVAVEGEDGHVDFSVIDTGIGIDPEAQEFIFEPFRQADSSMTRRFGGVGLGLYIVRRLLDMLGGTVAVESQLGQGSTFRVHVPARSGNPEL